MDKKMNEWIYDWNTKGDKKPISVKSFDLLDETLRDGIQSPSVREPNIDEKIEILYLMEKLGIAMVDIGLPGASQNAFESVLSLANTIQKNKIKIKPTCAARTVIQDIAPISDIVQKTGLPIEVYAFIGSSPIRLFSEDWTVDTLIDYVEKSVKFAIQENLDICLVTEDTTRSNTEILEPLFTRALDLGVKRLCICDTVGHATPEGISHLFSWLKSFLQNGGYHDIKIDWHGHNDRGLAVINSISAIQNGADCVHGTGLGVGERVGNAAIDQILVNLKLLDEWPHDLSNLLLYCETVSRICKVDIPYNYPMAGKDAFRTATGVHAAAIIKAQKKGDSYIADRIYSSVPASIFGKKQTIDIGYMSGLSNVKYFLQSHNINFTDTLAQHILEVAKKKNHVLSDKEIYDIIKEYQKL